MTNQEVLALYNSHLAQAESAYRTLSAKVKGSRRELLATLKLEAFAAGVLAGDLTARIEAQGASPAPEG